MKTTRIAIAFAAALALAACATDQGPKQSFGTLIGAGLGGLAGSQIGSGTGQLAAVGAGVLLGGLLGNEVGRSLDKADQAYVARTAQYSLESAPVGTTSTWTNPDSGNSGSFTPTRTYEAAQGQYCREYQTTVTVGGATEEAYGTACRQPDGSWKVVN
ncbi:MAG: RT0821/Lpp0805 family surface protein [Alphaproteobacteria bacterium]